MLKKLLSITSVFLFVAFATTAQSVIPNAGFETWSGNDAQSWNNLNSVSSGSCQKATAAADVHSGTAAIELTTTSVFFNTAPGTATTGTINFLSQTVTGGTPFNARPDSLVGWYKYVPSGTDAGNIVGLLFGANRDTIAVAPFFPTGNINSYTRFAVPFVYRSPATPDTAVFVLASSGASGGQVGTVMFVDDLGLTYSAVGIETPFVNNAKIYPNPANDELYFSIPETGNYYVSVYDITGRMMSENVLSRATNKINTATLPEGIYIYKVYDNAHNLIEKGKFAVSR